MWIVIVSVVILTSLTAVVTWIQKRYSIWKDMGVLYKEPHFPYGSFKGVKENAHEGQTMEKIYQKFKGKTPFVGIYFALEPIALILDIDLVKRVLISDFSAFADRGFWSAPKHEPISRHIATASTNRWKNFRAILSPAFTAGKLKSMFPICSLVSAQLDSKLEEICKNGEELDVKNFAARYTMDIIGVCILGLDCGCLKDETNEFFEIMTGIFDNPLDSTAGVLIKLALRHHAETLKLRMFRKEVNDFFEKVVKKAFDYRISNGIDRNDLMATLIDAYKNQKEDQISFNDILGQTFGFFTAGYETSASTIQFLLYELAKNQDLQQKARRHIFGVLEEHQNELTFESLSAMKFLDQLIFETLRRYPVLSNLTRELVKDYQVPNTNAILRRGTLAMIPAYAIHHDSEFYSNPHEFDPDRFSEENVKPRPPTTFLGFGDGPRNCIGGKLGFMQTKIGIVAFLRKYEYSLAKRSTQPLELVSRTFLTCPSERIYLNVRKIDSREYKSL